MIYSNINGEPDRITVSENSCAKRLCRAYADISCTKGTWSDFAIHLRHCILNYNRKLFVTKDIKNVIESTNQDFGFSFIDYGDKFEVDVVERYPDWLDEKGSLKKIYNYELPKKEQIVGDPYLFNMTGYKYYSSTSQKFAIKASMNQPDGTTLLACLPTGGGKSLIGQMPAFYDEKGLTIVIVPTVALAIDQAQSSSKFFRNKNYLPRSYHSGVSFEAKNQMFSEIRQGKLPLLFISPESVLNGSFNDVILEAAGRGLINRFVIDEAHIVIDWGDYFRTEFQFLSVFRKKLLKATNGKLKTVLLSATLSDRTTDTLKLLFGEKGSIIEVRGDHLRYEIMYYLTRSNNDFERKRKALDILPYLPRPLIIYVDKPETAEKLKNQIIEKRLKSVETFTGDTPADERERLIELWNRDEIDIMVATSAFGMGVDKQDVRGVIHCYIPENLNRFYQEVGRAGRDGLPCFSILNVTTNEDYSYINYLTRSKVAKVDTIVDRWFDIKDMFISRESGDEFWVDTDVTPNYLRGVQTGQLSATWNEYVILFLYRKGLIDILDVKLHTKKDRYHILVKMLDIERLTDNEALTEYLTPIREDERNAVDQDIREVKEIAKDYHSECWSHFFTSIYGYTNNLCRGCPACRYKDRKSYNTRQYLFIPEGKNLIRMGVSLSSKEPLEDFEGEKELLYEADADEMSFDEEGFIERFSRALESGISNLIIPDMDKEPFESMIEKLTTGGSKYYSIYTYEEVLKSDFYPILDGITAIVYTDNEDDNNKLFGNLRRQILRSEGNRIVHIAPYGLSIEYEERYLRDCIDSPSNSL